MKRDRTILAAAAIAAYFAAVAPAAAQDAGLNAQAATTHEELLEKVSRVRDDERQRFEERVAEFDTTAAGEQQAKLTAAQSRRDDLLESADVLSDQYTANETAINDRNRELLTKAAALGLAEVFGIARQVAGDVATFLSQSLITTQFPPAAGEPSRDALLREFAAARTVPTTSELEQFWVEMQRELTASGQVARYRTAIVEPTGAAVEVDVVRIGPFMALTDEGFVEYSPALQTLNVLPRQPPGELLGTSASFLGTGQGSYGRAVVDSTRGVLLALYVERPTFVERIELGETIGYIIIVVGAAGGLAFLFQLWSLVSVRLKVARQLKNLDNLRADNPLGRVFLAFKGDPNRIEEDADIAELRISEAVLREVPALERFQAFLRLTVAAGPLLGLIGTVLGMIETFQSITESGSSDPRLMADGIGKAMIATVLGLGIAIPLLFANALLNSLSRSVVQLLDEQSTGVLAESLERQRRA